MKDNRFGAELRRLRRQAGLTLADLADALDCSIAYVSDIERGRKNPPNVARIKVLLALMNQEERLGAMLLLAAQTRQSIEIDLGERTDEVTNMLLALARRCDEDDLDEEVVRKIHTLLDEGRSS